MADIKAGVPHLIKVNTKADRFGVEDGFTLKYFNDTTKEMTSINTPFFEFEEDITPATVKTVGDHKTGDEVIKVSDTPSAFKINGTCKVGGNYYRIISIDRDNNTITLRNGLTGSVPDDSDFEVSGRTGTYGIEITFPSAGSYTVHITNFNIGMDNEAIPVMVKDADIDDVKTVLDEVKSQVDSVKSQVDTLDEEELNGLNEKLEDLTTTINALHSIMKDSSDVYIEISGNVTDIIKVGNNIKGDNSNATGTVQYIEFDENNDITKITLQSSSGTFENGETINNGTDSTTKTITKIKNNVTNSVIEWVKEIETILNGSNGVGNLKIISEDITHILNGDEKLENGDDCPTAGKGLKAIFDNIISTHSDVDNIKELANDTVVGFQAIKVAVNDSRVSIENKIDAVIDADDENSLLSKINLLNTIVNANKHLLENETFGLSNILDKLNNINSLFNTGGDIEVRLTNLDTALESINSLINNQTLHIDGKFNEVMNKLNKMERAGTYSVLV